MGVFTGTLLGAEGEREQLTLSCSVKFTEVRNYFFYDSMYCDVKFIEEINIDLIFISPIVVTKDCGSSSI